MSFHLIILMKTSFLYTKNAFSFLYPLTIYFFYISFFSKRKLYEFSLATQTSCCTSQHIIDIYLSFSQSAHIFLNKKTASSFYKISHRQENPFAFSFETKHRTVLLSTHTGLVTVISQTLTNTFRRVCFPTRCFYLYMFLYNSQQVTFTLA